MKTACKKSTLTRNGSVAKLAIFTVRTRAACQRFYIKPMEDRLGLIRAFQAKIDERHHISAPTRRVVTVADS